MLDNTNLIKSFLPEKAFKVFEEAEICFKNQGLISNEILETLHTHFGETLSEATEMFDKSKIVLFTTSDGLRRVYQVTTGNEQLALFENINFCHCPAFGTAVLASQSALTCPHVLTMYLAKITDNYDKQPLEDNVFEEYLNSKLTAFIDIDKE